MDVKRATVDIWMKLIQENEIYEASKQTRGRRSIDDELENYYN